MAYHTEGRRLLRAGTAIALAGGLALGGCGEGTEGGTFGFLKPKADTAAAKA